MIQFWVPIKTRNPLNNLRHWRAISKERNEQKNAVRLAWMRRETRPTHSDRKGPASWRITLTRHSTGTLDKHDGLPASLKAIVDEVATLLGYDDDNDERLEFVFRQQKCARGKHGVLVEIEEAQ